MNSTFHIRIHPSEDSVHLKLEGDFDGDSAYELLVILKKNCRWATRAFIHTSNLSRIHPSARMVLETNLGALNGKCLPLLFTGDHADLVAPRPGKIS